MKIIADQHIPYVADFFKNRGQLITLPSEKITNQNIKNADVLLIRSVTNVNKALLKNTNVRFVGSATAGIDHLNIHDLEDAKITWTNAPGCNANAVADYVLISIANLTAAGYLNSEKIHAGIIGVGRVGERVRQLFTKLNFDVVTNDPPRAEKEIDFSSTPLDQFHDLDIICLHTPLTKTGKHPSHHLIDKKFLSQLNKKTILLNAGRGAVIDTNALKQQKRITILDVWENEPNIDPSLVESAFIATPHIAGYSQAAKFRATKQLYEAFRNHFETDQLINIQEAISHYANIDLSKKNWTEKVLQVENLINISNDFKKAIKKKSKQHPQNVQNPTQQLHLPPRV